MNPIFDLAIKASYLAGEEILKYYDQDFEVVKKNDDTPVTIADKKSSDMIVSILSQTGIPVMSEEEDKETYEIRKKWSKFWMIDPLDGTREFISHNGEFCINIAYLENNIPVFGIIYIPVTKVIYFGGVAIGKSYKYQGEYTEDIISKSKVLQRVEEERYDTVIAGGRSQTSERAQEYFKKLRKEKGNFTLVMIGSAIKFGLIAEGKADVYPRFSPTMEWDTCSAQALLEPLGIEIVHADTGNPLKYNKRNLLNPDFICGKVRE